MNILIVSEYFYPLGKGGGEISGFLYAKKKAAEGNVVTVLTSYFEGLKKRETVDGVKIVRSLTSSKSVNSLAGNIKRRMFFEASMLREIEKLDKEKDFGLIHCMNATSISAVKIRDKIKKRFLLHVNSPVLFCPKGTLMYKDKEECKVRCSRKNYFDCYLNSSLVGKFELSPLMKYNPFMIYFLRKTYEDNQKLLKKFDEFIAISKFMKRCLVRSGVSEKKVNVIYPLIEEERFRNLKLPSFRTLKIPYLGEYSKPKGPQVLMEALKNIKKPYIADFYGEGVLRDYLVNVAKENKLNANIHGKADYDEIPRIMEEHNVVVVPSLVPEGFGRVALEASVAGRKVIVHKVGGLGEVGGDIDLYIRNPKRISLFLSNYNHM